MYERLFDFLATGRAIYILAAVMGLTGLLLGLNHLPGQPTQTEAAETVFGDLLRYDELHGDPHVVFHHNSRVYFDELERDYKGLIARRSTGWVMTGAWYFIPATDNEPASVGVARCTGVMGEACGKETEIFGQINSPDIVAMEVKYDGEWLRYAVDAPGYAVRLEDRHEVPTEYRWLDSSGEIVFTQGYTEPLTPGFD